MLMSDESDSSTDRIRTNIKKHGKQDAGIHNTELILNHMAHFSVIKQVIMHHSVIRKNIK